MRSTRLLAGFTFVLVACGGGENQQQAQPATPAPAPAAVTPPAGATHNVNMVLEGAAYKYVPAQLTIKPGDKVVFHNISGFPHNVAFWSDSIPAGAAAPLDAAMTGDKLGPLSSQLMLDPNSTYEIVFASLPNGEYKFYCTPHLAMGMTGKITIAP
jgi:plastocyanin